jgi:hypothetical protein
VIASLFSSFDTTTTADESFDRTNETTISVDDGEDESEVEESENQ